MGPGDERVFMQRVHDLDGASIPDFITAEEKEMMLSSRARSSRD